MTTTAMMNTIINFRVLMCIMCTVYVYVWAGNKHEKMSVLLPPAGASDTLEKRLKRAYLCLHGYLWIKLHLPEAAHGFHLLQITGYCHLAQVPTVGTLMHRLQLGHPPCRKHLAASLLSSQQSSWLGDLFVVSLLPC